MTRPVVAFGDSYTQGTGAHRNEAYPALLEDELGIKVINAGRAGETASEAILRLRQDVLVHLPRLVIVEFGVNEAFRGHSVQRCVDGLRRILIGLREARIPALLVGVRFAHFQEDFDDALRALARDFGTGLVLDVLHGVLGVPGLGDAHHPTAAGYRIMEGRIRPEVERMLGL